MQATDLIPGSRPARDAGCRCPVANNNNGERCPFPPNGWITTLDCALHGLPDVDVYTPSPSKVERRRRRTRA